MSATEATPEKRWVAPFLAELARTTNVSAACKKAHIERSTAYRRKEADPEFALAWEQAIEEGIEALEEVARRRAVKQSDTLMIFLLKAHRPERYRERVEHSGTVTLESIVRALPTEFREAVSRELGGVVREGSGTNGVREG